MKIFAGSDHAGFPMKLRLLERLKELGHETVDLGSNSAQSCDYPDFAHGVARKVQVESGTMGLLVCGSGIGMSIAANRHCGIRAALCRDALEARLSREHNDANILVLGSRIIGEEQAVDCLETFFITKFSGGRHEKRLRKIEETAE